MTRIKICGIKRVEDVGFLNSLLPDYAGFVFAGSSRQVGVEEALFLMKSLDKRIKTVGVFLDQEPEEVRRCAAYLKLDVVQLHGSEGKGHLDALKGFRVWKAACIGKGAACQGDELREHLALDVEAVLLDSSRGGSGVSFDWNIAPKLDNGRKVVLAGGLSPDNVGEAIRRVRPWAVDVSSGVEEDGTKSYEKIKDFIEKARKTR